MLHIQIRGTSGSGKTTVMRQVMDKLKPWASVFCQGRKKPLYYRNPDDVVVLGHYESACGGCDNIGSAAQVYDLLISHKASVFVCEGLLLSEDVKWSSQLENLKIVFLNTPIEQCLAQVTSRRIEAGNTKPLNPNNTQNRVGVIERARLRLQKEGVDCRRASSEQASSIILNWIREELNGSRT